MQQYLLKLNNLSPKKKPKQPEKSYTKTSEEIQRELFELRYGRSEGVPVSGGSGRRAVGGREGALDGFGSGRKEDGRFGGIDRVVDIERWRERVEVRDGHGPKPETGSRSKLEVKAGTEHEQAKNPHPKPSRSSMSPNRHPLFKFLKNLFFCIFNNNDDDDDDNKGNNDNPSPNTPEQATPPSNPHANISPLPVTSPPPPHPSNPNPKSTKKLSTLISKIRGMHFSMTHTANNDRDPDHRTIIPSTELPVIPEFTVGLYREFTVDANRALEAVRRGENYEDELVDLGPNVTLIRPGKLKKSWSTLFSSLSGLGGGGEGSGG